MLAEKHGFKYNMTKTAGFGAAIRLVCIEFLFDVVKTNKFMIIQSNEREIDIALARQQYRTDIYLLNDFLFHIGSYAIHIVQAIPNKKLSYAMILRPFDGYIWVYIVISAWVIMIAFVVIEMVSTQWTKLPQKDLAYLSNQHYMVTRIFEYSYTNYLLQVFLSVFHHC